MKHHIVHVPEDAKGKRLDVWLATRPELGLSRSWAQKLVEAGSVAVDGRSTKSAYRLKGGEAITVDIPEPQLPELIPQEIEIPVVYEDDQIIVVNKPRGMVVHPAAGNYTGTLVNALLARIPTMRDLSPINGVLRPGIVHRLDKDTTGLMVVAKTAAAMSWLSAEIKARRVNKVYLAIVIGNPPPEGTVDAPIGRHKIYRKKMTVTETGKPAVTRYKVLEQFANYALVELKLDTGRTHQIRVHMSYIGHPVAGDPVYSKKAAAVCRELGLKGQALHAYTLGFLHPVTRQYVEFKAPLPPDMAHALELLRSGA
ncbi:MAG TPA: RluA family pseudouridine synthase [Firmicutes bacterium]|nr:RluA family pseudouridine synthase [Bacillota bacterium]